MPKFDFESALQQGALSTFVTPSRASKGVLPKREIVQNGTRFFLKTGSVNSGFYNKLLPLSEVMACELGKLLWLEVADYQLYVIPEGVVEDSVGEVYVTASPSFYDDSVNSVENYTSMAVSMTGMDIPNAADYYQLICSNYNEYVRDINAMIVFDYIIDNPDRHLNNFGLIENLLYEESLFAPLYDHGQSLLSMIPEEGLDFTSRDLGKLYDRKADANPFNRKQSKAIKKVQPNIFLDINSSLTDEDFEDWMAPFKVHLSASRADAILSLVKRRYYYVQRNILSSLG